MPAPRLAPLHARPPHTSPAISSAVARVDLLEPRQFLSVAPGSVALAPDSLALAPTVELGAVSALPFGGKALPAKTGQYNLSVKAGVDVNALAAKAGFTNLTPLGGNFYTVTSALAPADVEEWAKQNRATVASLAPNYVFTTAAAPNDPLYAGNQYALNNTGQQIPNPATGSAGVSGVLGTAGVDIDAQLAWDLTTGSATQVVAVFDTGIDVTHPDLLGNLYQNVGESGVDANNVLKSANGVDDDGNGFVDDFNGLDVADRDGNVADASGHGTQVAGIIAASGNNAVGIAGVSWTTKILTIKIFSDSTPAATDAATKIAGLNYMLALKRQGVNIVAANFSQDDVIPSLQDAGIVSLIKAATELGIVTVSAAGNSGINVDNFLTEPARSTFASGALVVAATDNRDQLATTSNFGASTVQVAAPGVDIFTTTVGGGYDFVSGTSFAAPIVTGIVALAKAAAPNATPAQIIAAVKEGVDPVASLRGLTSNAPNNVQTGGRVNAYKTLRFLQNKVASVNTTTQGNWIGAFGSLGSFVYGGTTGAATITGLFPGSSLTPAGSSVIDSASRKVKATDVRLPLTNDATTRSTSSLRSEDTLTLSFDFGDVTTPRRLTAYFVDAENTRREQTVQLADAVTGTILRSVTLKDFRQGQYVSFEATGKVSLVILGDENGAVLNALYVDPVATAQNGLVAVDATTGGDWTRFTGDQGQVLPSLVTAVPTGVTFTSTGAFTSNSSARRSPVAPVSPAGGTTRSTGQLTGNGFFDSTVNVTDGSTRRVSFYTYNTGKTARGQRIDVIDPASNTVKATVDLTLARNAGQYATFDLSGNNTVRVTSLGGGAPSLAGVFFSGSPKNFPASGNNTRLVSTDTTTGGRWKGRYGTAGNYVVGASNAFPSFVTSAPPAAGLISIVNPATSNKAAPQNPNTTTGGIVGYVQTQTSTDITLTRPASDGTRQVSLYFVDFDRKNRVQRLDAIDPTTGAVVSSQVVRDFRSGKYVTFEVTGSVVFRLTRLAGPTAVVSAVFFD